MSERLRGCFATIADPRVARTRLHQLHDILAIAILSVLAGGQESGVRSQAIAPVKPSRPVQPSPPAPVQQTETESTDEPAELEGDANPLNPAGDSLDKLIQMRVNDDLWKSMLGDLPCLEVSDRCIGQLQTVAIDKSKTLQAIGQRIEVINTKIEEARKNNQKTIVLGG